MKVPLLSCAFFFSALTLLGQTPISTDEALKQLYHNYDPATKTAQWVCTKAPQAEPDRTCQDLDAKDVKDETVSVSILLAAQVPEGGGTRFYLATSVKPGRNPEEFGCHACVPAIGAAVFIWDGEHWALESANSAASYSGGWGEPPEVGLISIGPQKHGLILSSTNMAQGYVSSVKELLAPIGKSVEEIWSLDDENDNFSAINPDEKTNDPTPYRMSAGFRFLSDDDGAAVGNGRDYYNIEVISRGYDRENFAHPIKSENWTEIYTFENGKYRLLRRTIFTEIKRPAKTRTK